MSAFFKYDFGYTWPWVYGHLGAAIVFLLLGGVAWRLGWPRSIRIASAAGFVWALAGFLIVHGVLRFNQPLSLPTERFLASARAEAGAIRSGLCLCGHRLHEQSERAAQRLASRPAPLVMSEPHDDQIVRGDNQRRLTAGT